MTWNFNRMHSVACPVLNPHTIPRSNIFLNNHWSLHTDTTPPQPNHNVTPTHIEPEQYNPWNNSTNKSQAPEDGCINIRNMLSIKYWNNKASGIKLVSLYSTIKMMHGPINIRCDRYYFYVTMEVKNMCWIRLHTYPTVGHKYSSRILEDEFKNDFKYICGTVKLICVGVLPSNPPKF